MDEPEVQVMLAIIIKMFFFGIYGDCLISLDRLCKKVGCKKGTNSLKKINPIMYYIGNDALSYMQYKSIKMRSPDGMTIIKRVELRSLMLEGKMRMLDALLFLLEDHPMPDPNVINQLNNIGRQSV